jgi:hypothetical protein
LEKDVLKKTKKEKKEPQEVSVKEYVLENATKYPLLSAAVC